MGLCKQETMPKCTFELQSFQNVARSEEFNWGKREDHRDWIYLFLEGQEADETARKLILLTANQRNRPLVLPSEVNHIRGMISWWFCRLWVTNLGLKPIFNLSGCQELFLDLVFSALIIAINVSKLINTLIKQFIFYSRYLIVLRKSKKYTYLMEDLTYSWKLKLKPLFVPSLVIAM